MRFTWAAAVALAATAGDGRGQFRGFGGPPDPEMMWRFMAGGDVPSVDLNQRPDIRDRMARRGGAIPAGGILTKEAFIDGFKKRMAERADRGPKPPESTAAPASTDAKPPDQPRPPSPAPSTPAPDAAAATPPPPDEPVVRPTVYRFGKLPKDLPAWFPDLDTDADGQVGLYEWRKAGKPTAEFVGLDGNGDGYLTAGEWQRQSKADKPAADAGQKLSSTSADPAKDRRSNDRRAGRRRPRPE